MKRDYLPFLFMVLLCNSSDLKKVAPEMYEIKNEKPNIKLLIVGEERDALDDLQKLKEEYHLDNQVILTGKQPYECIPKFLAAADICLLPAYPTEKIIQDIVPIKMYEYMAMGKPVIATKLPGVMKEFGEGNGVIYVDKTEDVLKKAVELMEGELLTEYGSKARGFVESYGWDDVVDEFEGILADALRWQI